MLVEDQTPKSVYSDQSFVYLIIYNRFQIGLRKIHIYCRILMYVFGENIRFFFLENTSEMWYRRGTKILWKAACEEFGGSVLRFFSGWTVIILRKSYNSSKICLKVF